MDVNRVFNDGTTALHKASENGRVVLVMYLLRKGASAQLLDRFGHTPSSGHPQRHLNIKRGGLLLKGLD